MEGMPNTTNQPKGSDDSSITNLAKNKLLQASLLAFLTIGGTNAAVFSETQPAQAKTPHAEKLSNLKNQATQAEIVEARTSIESMANFIVKHNCMYLPGTMTVPNKGGTYEWPRMTLIVCNPNKETEYCGDFNYFSPNFDTVVGNLKNLQNDGVDPTTVDVRIGSFDGRAPQDGR